MSGSEMVVNETTGSGMVMDEMMNFSCRSFNLSSTSVTNKTFWEIDENQREGVFFVGAFVVLLFVIGTIWNLFIIVTFLVKYRLLKEPANIFLLNIAIMDLLFCFTVMIFTFVPAFALEFVFGDNDVIRCAICDMAGFFLIFLVFSSLHLLMVLSIDRFILLSRPLRYQRLMSPLKAVIIIFVMYAVSFVIAILPVVGFGQYEFNRRLAYCPPRFTPFENVRYLILAAGEAFIIIVVVAITNVGTYRLVSKFLKRNFRRRSTYHQSNSATDKTAASQEQTKHQKQQKQLVKVFAALLVATIITYTPTMLASFLAVGFDNLPSTVTIICFICFLLSAVIHPILESFFVKELRYQVNRAKKGVRRFSSSVYRKTSSYFSNKTLDEAARKADDESIPTAKRPIRFLNGKVMNNKSHDMDISTATEMEDMGDRSTSPSVSSRSRTPVDARQSSTTPDPPRASSREEERPVLSKSRRSVTFTDNLIVGPSPKVDGPTISKSSLSESFGNHKENSIPAIVEEDTSTKEESNSEEGQGSGSEDMQSTLVGKGLLDSETEDQTAAEA